MMNFLATKGKACLMSLLMLLTLNATAQDVTISPSSGRLIAGLGLENEVGFIYGWKSLWWHNQLPLKVISSDKQSINSAGIPVTHACNLAAYNGSLVLSELDASTNSYLVATLPEGYRFTGYEIVLVNDLDSPVSGKEFTRAGNEWKFYETNSSFDTSAPLASVSLGSTKSSTERKIERESQTDTDMGDCLYFVFHGNDGAATSSNRAIIRIEKFVVYFSSEGDFNVSVAPTEDNSTATSFAEVEFPSGKIGLGDIRRRTQTASGQTATHYAYEFHEVEELNGKMLIYNENALDAEKKVADNGEKTITQEVQNFSTSPQHWFGLKNHTYYVESPVEVVTTHGNHDPVGYRITSARINYSRGEAQDAISETVTYNSNMFTISCELPIDGNSANGKSVYYLHPSGRFVRAQEGETTTKLWQMDAEGHIYHYQDGIYTYLTWNKHVLSHTSSESAPTGSSNTFKTFTTGGNKYIYWAYDSDSGYDFIRATWNSDLAAYRLTNYHRAALSLTSTQISSNHVAVWQSAETTRTVSQPAFTPSDFTLKVYDKTGTSVEHTVSVNSSNASGTVTLSDLNNDAIKFEISGLEGADARALVTVDVTMQTLDPYIRELEIKCTDNSETQTEVQTFSATDFAVRGGKFTINVPESWSGSMPCKFSFEELMTDYLDETYYPGETRSNIGGARNFLVGSEYYPTDAANYKSAYDVTQPTASATDADDYDKKVRTLYCGTQPFYFSNADELDHDIASTDIRTLHQYQFSLERYASQSKTARTNSSGQTIYTGYDAGEFHRLTMNDNEEAFAYLFIGDEPRYNIAPTTGTEHRMYAYYNMDIVLSTKTYSPAIEWTKLYDETCYNQNGKDASGSFWGLTVKTTETDGSGYLPISSIVEEIGKRTADDTSSPKSLSQVLYVDATPLSSIIYASNSGTEDEVAQLKKQLADNALFLMPKGQEYHQDNFASISATDELKACEDIVITDRKPFFAPKDIHVLSPNKATYTREITWKENQAVARGTLILPFPLELSGGEHESNGYKLQLYKMKSADCLSVASGEGESEAFNFFDKIEGNRDGIATESEANVPYMFAVTETPEGEQDKSFTVSQTGIVVKATTGMDSDNLYTGETSTGNFRGTAINFTHQGSYTGKKLDKSVGYFYFGNDMLLNSLNLKTTRQYVYVYPFRSFYAYTASGGAKELTPAQLQVIFGDDGEVNAIGGITRDGSLTVATGRGTLTVLSDTSLTASIRNLAGAHVRSLSLDAGLPLTVNLPAGIYLVNQTKVVVK